MTAELLAPRESDCSWMHSKVSSDWMLSNIKVTRPVHEILKWFDTFRRGPVCVCVCVCVCVYKS